MGILFYNTNILPRDYVYIPGLSVVEGFDGTAGLVMSYVDVRYFKVE